MMMDTAMRARVIEELRRNGYEGSDVELRRLAETVVGQTTAMRVAMVDLAEAFTRDTWPGRALVRVADVISRTLERIVDR